MATRFYSTVEYGNRSGADADVVYYNANIVNNSTDDVQGNTQDPQVAFNESRQTPILRDPSDYMMSVIQLSYTGALQNLPMFIPRIQVSQPSVLFTATLSAAIAGIATLTVISVQRGVIQNGQALVVPGLPPYTGTVIIGGGGGYTGTGSTGTYQVTVSGFPTISAPTVMEQVLNQNDPNLTIYSITVDGPGGTSRAFLKWVPPNQYAEVPSIPVITQNLTSDYYYCYALQTMIDMANTAYQTALTGAGVPTPSTYLISNAGITSFNGQDPQVKINLPAAPYKVYFNTAMESIFPNLPGQYFNQDQGRFFQIGSNVGGDAIQERGGTNSWNPVVSLTVTSNLLPINLEQCATPVNVGASSANSLGAISPGTYLPVVADDIIPTSIQGSQFLRQSFLSEPSAEYRMVSLTGTAPLTQIDFNVWWRCRLDNSLYPLRLVSGSSVSLKVLFRRKQMGV